MAVAQPAGTNRVVSTTANIDAKFSNDGAILYLVEGQTIRAVASASGETVRRFDLTFSVGAIDVSADGRFLSAVGRGEGSDVGESAYKVSRIDLTTAAITTFDTRSIAPNVSVYDGAFQADGTLLLTQRGISGASYGLINVDFNTGQFQFLNSSVKGDATLIASGDHNRIYIKAQPIDDTPLYFFASGGGITAEYHNYIADPYAGAFVPRNNFSRGVMATTSSGNFVVINEFLTVFDTSLNKVASLSTNVPFFGAVAFAFSPSGDKLYALSPTKQIIVFDTATWIATNVYPSLTERQVTDHIGGRPTPYGNFLQVSPDGKYLSVLAYGETQILDLTKLLPDGGTPANDVLSGEYVFGLDGDDILAGNGLYGGRGNDTYIVDNLFSSVNEAANHGIDQVNSSVNFELLDNVENLTLTGTASIYGFGNAADNLMTGNAGANRLNGKEGQNTLRGMAGDDILGGGSGNDIFDGGDGIDVASFANATAGVRIDLVTAATQPVSVAGAGTDQLISIEGLEGSNFADVLFGTGSSNVLRGLESDDYLDGRGGTDTLDGGNGSDTYVVYTAADVVIETDSNGSDIVYTKSDYTLAPGTSVEVLSTAQNDAAGNLRLTGNSNFQRIIGDYGANILTGGGGRDTLLGLRGNDTYVIDTASAFPGGENVVFENAGEGFDTVVASAAAGASSFTLTAGSEIELLQAAGGTAAINITGNNLAQRIEGNGGNNILNGGGGSDTLVGFAGNDQYLVRELGSIVIEGNGGGTDTVFTTVSYNLGVNEVEVLSTVTNSETTPIDLIGNFATQTVVGNNGNNVLNGGSGGADRLIGLRGNDVYAVGSQSIEIVENAGQGDDTLVAFSDYQIRNGVSIEVFAAQNRGGTEALVLRGNEVAQTVIGNAGNNVIDGRGGADVLVGDAGADTFAFTTSLGFNNVDTIQDFASGTDRIGLASDIFAGLAGSVSAGSFVLGSVATDADDRVLYDQATGQLFYDADANGAGAAAQFAQLMAGAVLSAADFVIVAPVGDLAV